MPTPQLPERPLRRALVTGSSDGIGARIADLLGERGLHVTRHARNADRAAACRTADVPDGDVVIGDFSSLESTRAMAAGLQDPLHVVVHNAGVLPRDGERPVTADGLETTFQVNVVGTYLLVASLPMPQRMVFVSSDSITRGRVDLDDLQHTREWTADAAYADSKLAMTVLCMAVARRYPQVLCTAVHPGWVRTKMSGDVAPLSLDEGADTPAWLATSHDAEARVSGGLYFERRLVRYNEQCYDERLQDGLVAALTELAGVPLP